MRINRKQYKLLKTLGTMIKKLIYGSLLFVMYAALMVLVSPVILIFSKGEDGELTIWNFVGMAWLVMLILVGKTVSR